MNRVLIVEDSRVVLAMLRQRVERELGMACDCAATLAEAEAFLRDMSEPYLAALVDLNLPDAPRGEAVDAVNKSGVPVIVFTATLNDDVQQTMWRKRVVDYVIKDGHANMDYVVGLVRRLAGNRAIKTLVVDDAAAFRTHAARLLRAYQYTVIEAVDAESALATLKEHPDVSLILVDNTMPGMSGVEFVQTVRRTRPKDDLAIIGMSGEGESKLSAKFLKYGANDYLHKPFSNEQFYCRVNQNMDMLELVRKLRDSSHKDFLTGLFNRRYLFETGKKMLKAAQRTSNPVVVAMIDIDKFKGINDTYGHDAGDAVLVHMAKTLKNRFRDSDIVARLGGEEFCIVAVNMDPASAAGVFEDVRRLAECEVETAAGAVPVTVSIGVSLAQDGNLEERIAKADALLYAAKENGRNRVEL